MAWLPQARAHEARAALRELMPLFAYACCVPFGREPDAQGRLGLMWRAAAHEPAADALLAPHRGAARARRAPGAALRRRQTRPAPHHRVGGRRRRAARARLPAGRARPTPSPGCARCWSTTGPCRPMAAGCCAPAPSRRARCRRARRRCAPATTSAKRASARCWLPSSARPRRGWRNCNGPLRCGTECGSCLPTLKRLVAEPAAA